MSISRRKKGKSHHHHHKRRRLGGYISGNTDPGVGYDNTLLGKEKDRMKKRLQSSAFSAFPHGWTTKSTVKRWMTGQWRT